MRVDARRRAIRVLRQCAKCEEWDFRNSTCPSNPKGHHQSRNQRECIENCVNRRTPLPGCFPEGPGEVCTHEIFNDPYFVHVHSDGVRRCHKSEFQHLKTHRCVDESKRFNTMKECMDVCESKGKRLQHLTDLPMRLHSKGTEKWTGLN
ncbi:hypothetical protein V5799_006542 [Amblyomma americanum]|uniref:Uncharacterized protein n=1 Tax=Amblyomma americanum TaxID=6943 RepID=A0AAQ4DW37_AMBAM